MNVINESLAELGKKFHLSVVEDLSDFTFVKECIALLPYEFAKHHGVLPLEEKEGIVFIALSDPFDLQLLEEVRFFVGKEIKEVLASKESILQAIEMCYRQKEHAASQLLASLREGIEEKAEYNFEEYDLLSENRVGSPVVRMLNAILLEAIQQGASDVHFEPIELGIQIRYRVDGVLHMRHIPPKEYAAQIITRIKVMARLDIAEHRLPQDGRIKLKLGSREIDFRVSTIPVVYGERIVLRILDKSNLLLGLDQLGMRSTILSMFKKLIQFSEGIVLVTGPTGSGKTTTLYSALNELDSDEMNIMTIEDPVEYKLPSIAQIGINSKIHLTFATGLRHILRQDPDVIMIGEIRDRETAEIAIQASLTGHLVLTTLHTNDAPSALTRLVDMGIESYLLSSSVIGVLAQRLVRTICPHCCVSEEPNEKELKELGVALHQLKEGKVFTGKGCVQCHQTGYKGRLGIYELMLIDHTIRRQLVTTPESTQLQKIALSHGMSTLRQEGGWLVAQGLTTPTEVLRVTRNCEE